MNLQKQEAFAAKRPARGANPGWRPGNLTGQPACSSICDPYIKAPNEPSISFENLHIDRAPAILGVVREPLGRVPDHRNCDYFPEIRPVSCAAARFESDSMVCIGLRFDSKTGI